MTPEQQQAIYGETWDTSGNRPLQRFAPLTQKGGKRMTQNKHEADADRHNDSPAPPRRERTAWDDYLDWLRTQLDANAYVAFAQRATCEVLGGVAYVSAGSPAAADFWTWRLLRQERIRRKLLRQMEAHDVRVDERGGGTG